MTAVPHTVHQDKRIAVTVSGAGLPPPACSDVGEVTFRVYYLE